MNPLTKPARDLGQIQRWMQTVIMHPIGVEEGVASSEAQQVIEVGIGEVEQVVTRSRELTALERLGIYGTAYYARLLECLRGEFPVLLHALGQEVFDAFAIGYLQRYPSRSYTLCQLGANFARYLEETRPESEVEEGTISWPDFLIDLARLEWNFSEVFDGPGTEGEPLLDPARLQALPPDQWLDARLECVCCLRLLELRFPVQRYLLAVRRGQEPELPDPAETFLAVSRRQFVVRHYELSRPAYELLKALLAGDTISDSIVRAAEWADPEDDRLAGNLQKWFHDWAAEGLFRSVLAPEKG